MRSHAERLITRGARVGPLVLVDQLVPRQVGMDAERFAAHTTHVGPLVLVEAKVDAKRRRVGEHLVTDVANQRFPSAAAMHQFVAAKLSDRQEAFPANRAAEGRPVGGQGIERGGDGRREVQRLGSMLPPVARRSRVEVVAAGFQQLADQTG